MKTYLVAYHIRENDDLVRDFGNFYGRFLAMTVRARLFRSVWIVTTPLSARRLRKLLSRFLAPDDKLLVVECGAECSWSGLDDDVSDWLDGLFGTKIENARLDLLGGNGDAEEQTNIEIFRRV